MNESIAVEEDIASFKENQLETNSNQDIKEKVDVMVDQAIIESIKESTEIMTEDKTIETKEIQVETDVEEIPTNEETPKIVNDNTTNEDNIHENSADETKDTNIPVIVNEMPCEEDGLVSDGAIENESDLEENVIVASLTVGDNKPVVIETTAPEKTDTDEEDYEDVAVPVESKLVIVVDNSSPAANITSSDNCTTISITTTTPTTNDTNDVSTSSDKVKINPEDVKFVSCVDIHPEEKNSVPVATVTEDKESNGLEEKMTSEIITEIVTDKFNGHKNKNKVNGDSVEIREKENTDEIVADVKEKVEEKVDEKVAVQLPTTSTRLSVPPEAKAPQKSALQLLLGCFGCFKKQKT